MIGTFICTCTYAMFPIPKVWALRHRSAEEICSCELKKHGGVECSEISCCLNCNGPHHTRSNVWPNLQDEGEIQKLKVSYTDAMNLVNIPHYDCEGKSFSSIVRTQRKTVEGAVQTPAIFTFHGESLFRSTVRRSKRGKIS